MAMVRDTPRGVSRDLPPELRANKIMQTMTNLSLELSQGQFNKISGLIYKICGIKLSQGKEELVKSRLMKRLRSLKMSGFREYLNYLECDESGEELFSLVDALTTNKTCFFRESNHFDYLRKNLLVNLKSQRLRIWSAGCSSGEEPFSIAMTLCEELKNIDRMDVRILGTDVSLTMMEKAFSGVYGEETLQDISPGLMMKYFTCIQSSPSRFYKVNDKVRALVRLIYLNLMGEWAMNGPFDVIFCRNVMIYFDNQTREKLVNRFWELLEPGGHLFVGHSESMNGLAHKFKYVQPAVYKK